MKIKNKIFRAICCCSLTLGARLIGFIGVVISAALATALTHDKGRNNYNASRMTATILGIDWQHFHSSTNVTQEADPDGSMISIMLLSYSILYLVTSALLIIATFIRNSWLTIPWLLCEAFGYLSKIGALVFHAVHATKRYEAGFITGSIVYIVVITWWWLVVFAAQASWMAARYFSYSTKHSTSSYVNAGDSTLDAQQIELQAGKEVSTVQHPTSGYTANGRYTTLSK